MQNLEYANAYNEVLTILKFIPRKDYEKIPKNKIKVFEENANLSWKFTYNPNKTLEEQGASKITKIIIALLFRDYWSTDEQRKKILLKEKSDKNKEEQQKREKYNPNNIFKNENIQKDDFETVQDNVSMVEYKESILKRIFDKILKFLHS